MEHHDDDDLPPSDSDSVPFYESSCASDDEIVESDDESPWEPTLGDPSVHARVTQLSSTKCCSKRCLHGNVNDLEKFVYSFDNMTKEARRTSMLTSLGITSKIIGTKQQRPRTNERKRYIYAVPFIGEVCKVAFNLCYDVSNDTVTRARKQVQEGRCFVEPHKNSCNKHAAAIDEESVARWLRGVAETFGDRAAVRFRRQVNEGGQIIRYVTKQQVLFLPAHLTWTQLLDEYTKFCSDHGIDRIPSMRSFTDIARRRCRDIHVRSPRSNVCDICVLYRNAMTHGSTVDDSENAALHAIDARSMREQYAKDCGAVSEMHTVSTMDFAQNVALPHTSATPSSWYFLSLISVNVFGVFSQNSRKQTNFVYSERVAGKGSNEVISMLHAYALKHNVYGKNKVWTIYADNCGGQNKNSHVVRFLVFLVASGRLRSACLSFFIKGHTKNNCDRGFGCIKEAYVRKDLYTVAQVVDMVEQSSTANEAVNMETHDNAFNDWKSALEEHYNTVKGIQKFQLFSMDAREPGIVQCRKRPSSTPLALDLRKDKEHPPNFDNLISSIRPLAAPVVNVEKVVDLHKKLLRYIPEEYRSDPIYREPTPAESDEARSRKKKRLKVTQTLAERRVLASESKTQNDDGD